MNILKDRSVWIVIFVIILSGLYYWTVVDSERVDGMKTLEESDFDLSGDVTEWSEAYKRLELKWRGTSKHVKTLQNETNSHYKKYDAKVDSINNIFDRIEFKIDRMNETLTERLEDLTSELENLNEEFSSFKRATQRDGMKVRKNIEAIQEELKTLNTKIDEK